MVNLGPSGLIRILLTFHSGKEKKEKNVKDFNDANRWKKCCKRNVVLKELLVPDSLIRLDDPSRAKLSKAENLSIRIDWKQRCK